MEQFKAAAARPTGQPPASSSTSRRPAAATPLPMELRRGVAYDADLVAEVRRRLGEGLVDLRLAGA